MIGVVVGLVLAACPAETTHHHEIHFWVSPDGDSSDDQRRDDTFLDAQLARANGLFAGIDTCFVARTTADPALPTRVSTRAERDALGHDRFARGTIHVFVVDRLDDVDIAPDADGELTQIRGVHWRDRANRGRRWIILSRLSPPHVLAHELGHFFSLPHGDDPTSIMNKTWRKDPPEHERGFTKAELRRMKGASRRMRADGMLAPARSLPQ